MVLVRRRYYFWLFKAYIKKWRRTILTSVIIGAVAFFAFFLILNYYVFAFFKDPTEKVGYAGSYTVSTLPSEILGQVSMGLTKVNEHGEIKPAAAESWKISNNGKTVTFTLKSGLFFTNKDPFTAEDVSYSFKDVKKEVVNRNTVSFTMKNPYAPFLSVASKPILLKNHGLGDYFIAKTEQNGGFLKTLTLQSKTNGKKKIILFYPTQDALKTAFLLGEIDTIENGEFENGASNYFKDWKNVEIQKEVDYDTQVTVFFNTVDPTLSNKKVRQALSYALPEKFSEGERSFSFLPTHSIYYAESPNEGLIDLELSKELLAASNIDDISLTITSSDDLLPVAKKISDAWKKIGVKTKIVTSGDVPSNFEALIFPIKRPADPDLYTLWHSNQPNNITQYKNVRIDKLLEDGRTTMNNNDRIQIYADMQKYLLDDAPAAFLYFPYEYRIARKD